MRVEANIINYKLECVRVCSLDDERDRDIKPPQNQLEIEVAKRAKKKIVRKEYTASDVKLLKNSFKG